MLNTTTDHATRQYVELAELAGGFIHEIKNHINTLSLNLQLLAEDFELPETPRERKALERINRLNDECRRLVDLSNDFLRFARVTELNLERSSLEELISRMADFLGPTARAQGVQIHYYVAPELPLVMLDKEMFEKVLLNLMLNAEDAMPEGGQLTIQSQVENHSVIVDVIDTGCGMDPPLVERAFQPFVTTKPNGHGLGLATARKIVLAHGGEINVQSEPGRGTKFTIRLPIAPDAASDPGA